MTGKKWTLDEETTVGDVLLNASLLDDLSSVTLKAQRTLQQELKKLDSDERLSDNFEYIPPDLQGLSARDAIRSGEHVERIMEATEYSLDDVLKRLADSGNKDVGKVFAGEFSWPHADDDDDDDEKVPTIFVGHGRSTVWKEVRDLLRDRLDLRVDEFNRVPTAGVSTASRLQQMLDEADFAIIVLTGEDQTSEGTLVARQNVVHEAGLFQGKLGFQKAILLLEEGCEEFSNIHGLGQVRFKRDNVQAAFEELRRTLEREGLIATTGKRSR